MSKFINNFKTFLIFVLLILLLISIFHPDVAQQITAKVVSAVGG